MSPAKSAILRPNAGDLGEDETGGSDWIRRQDPLALVGVAVSRRSSRGVAACAPFAGGSKRQEDLRFSGMLIPYRKVGASGTRGLKVIRKRTSTEVRQEDWLGQIVIVEEGSVVLTVGRVAGYQKNRRRRTESEPFGVAETVLTCVDTRSPSVHAASASEIPAYGLAMQCLYPPKEHQRRTSGQIHGETGRKTVFSV